MFGIDDLFFILAGTTYAMAKGLNAAGNHAAREAYATKKGYNRDRQRELEDMVYSVDLNMRKRFNVMVGRTVDLDANFDAKLAVRQISLREGWQYYDLDEAYSDPYFVKIEGGKWPPGKMPGEYFGKAAFGVEKALDMNAETDRRMTWIKQCPHGEEVDVFPMDYDTEEDYRDAVKIQHSKKEKEKVYEKYSIYRKEKIKSYIAYQIDDIEFQWTKYKKYYHGAELGAKMCEWILLRYYKTNNGVENGYKILKEKCEAEGIDWDGVINRTNVGDSVMRYTQ